MSDADDLLESLDIVVPASLAGVRVDRALSMLSGLSRSEAAAVVRAGDLVIDERVVTKASLVLDTGQHVVATWSGDRSDAVRPDATVAVDVVLEDDDFVVVNKRAGQVVHPGAGQRDQTMIAGLLARYPEIQQLSDSGQCEPARPGVIHRLDKGTSGLLVVARSALGFESLSTQMADRLIERTYLGLVEGHVKEERGVVDAPLGRSTRTPTMMAVRADGRSARTGYEVLARQERPRVTLLVLRLETGRTHQIRVHLASIGHPVLNDRRYGHRRDRRLDEDRFFLHSTSLDFTHPRRDERVVTSADLPADLAALVDEGVL